MSFGIGHVMELRLQQTVETWIHASATGAMDAFGAAYAPHAEMTVPLLPEPVRGRDAIQQYETNLRVSFPEARLAALRMIIHDDDAAVEWEYSGANTGPLPNGLPPTGRAMKICGVSLLRFNPEGLITEEHRYYDARGLFQQLGLM